MPVRAATPSIVRPFTPPTASCSSEAESAALSTPLCRSATAAAACAACSSGAVASSTLLRCLVTRQCYATLRTGLRPPRTPAPVRRRRDLPLRFRVSSELVADRACVLRVEGEIDISTAESLRAHLAEALDAEPAV